MWKKWFNSRKAWETFESGFDTEVQGLFTTQPPFSSGLSYYSVVGHLVS